jgi:hypothetical protein
VLIAWLVVGAAVALAFGGRLVGPAQAEAEAAAGAAA